MLNSPAFFFIVKTVISGALIAAISSLAKTSPKLAALLTALPMMTFLSLIWIYWEERDLALLERYSFDVMILTIPSFLFFIAIYYLFHWRVPFVIALAGACAFLSAGIWLFHFMKWVR